MSNDNLYSDALQTETSLPIASRVPLTPVRKAPAFRLTPRDYQILRFLLEQKFAPLEALYFAFFDQRPNPTDPIPENFAVVRQRMGTLKRAGLVKTQKVYSESKSLFLLSDLGWKVLSSRFPNAVFGPAVRVVDFRNYDHDFRVTICRIALEKYKKASAWIPERRIRIEGYEQPNACYRLPDTIIPDAIFTNSKGERIALEVEASVRKKSRFRFKISEYSPLMTGPDPLIHKVLFIACSDSVGKDLAELLKGEKNFILETYSHFVKGLYVSSGESALNLVPQGGEVMGGGE